VADEQRQERRIPMTTVTGMVRNGQLELPQPLDLPDGTEVEILLLEQAGSGTEDDGPMTPEEIARVLAAMDRIEPLEITAEERAALEEERRARKEWEKAHFEERAEKLGRIWE
jgi:hypothetical protein